MKVPQGQVSLAVKKNRLGPRFRPTCVDKESTDVSTGVTTATEKNTMVFLFLFDDCV